MAKTKKTPVHYVDNKLLLQHMVGYKDAVAVWKEKVKQQKHDYQLAIADWTREVKEAEEERRNWIPDEPPKPKEIRKPQIPRFAADSIEKIALRLSLMPSFVNYPFREDMVRDGVLNCIEYIDNFNPAKSTNPFSYFTQIIYFAFIRRIKKEQKVTAIKVKAFDNLMLELELEGMTTELQGVQSTLSQKRDKTDA